jgi:hypothetical protein
MRTCARSGCSSPAVAILTYDREALIAYLSSVDDPASRAPGDLCARHLGRLVLPRSWQLDDRRERTAEPEVTRREPRPEKKLRAVPRAAVPRAKTPRTKTPRTVTPRPSRRAAPRPKWTEVGPSLFDAPAPDAVEPPAPHDPTATPTSPAWMPRFGPDSELDGVLDAKTPLLRRAFGGR